MNECQFTDYLDIPQINLLLNGIDMNYVESVFAEGQSR